MCQAITRYGAVWFAHRTGEAMHGSVTWQTLWKLKRCRAHLSFAHDAHASQLKHLLLILLAANEVSVVAVDPESQRLGCFKGVVLHHYDATRPKGLGTGLETQHDDGGSSRGRS